MVSPGIIWYAVLGYHPCWLNICTGHVIWGGVGAVCGAVDNCTARSLAILWSISDIISILISLPLKRGRIIAFLWFLVSDFFPWIMLDAPGARDMMQFAFRIATSPPTLMVVICGPMRYQLDQRGAHPFGRTRVINTVQS